MKNQNSAASNDINVELGFRHHQAGQLADAETLYLRALAQRPGNARALHLLGVIACQRDDFAKGAELIGKAITAGPASAEMHLHLGNALYKSGRMDEAARSFRKATRSDPSMQDAHANLAEILQQQGRLKDAEAAWRDVIKLAPLSSHAHFGLANTLHRQGDLEKAIATYRTAILLQPVYPDAYCNLGCSLREQGLFDEAVVALCTAIGQNQQHAGAYSNLGVTLKDMGRLAEAEAPCRVAAGLMPGSAVTQYNLACVLQDLGHHEEAEEHYRTALSLSPDYVEAHWNFALLLLRLGKFKEGWAEHEWRTKTNKPWSPKRNFPQPQWQGEPLAGKTVLVHSEQGLGDVIQFSRYASLLADRGAEVVFFTYPPLARLLQTVPGISRVTVEANALPPVDYHVPLLSLPFLLGTELGTIPAIVPYVQADAASSAVWRTRLAAENGRKIGLVWASDPRPNDPDACRIDQHRNLRLSQFSGLAEIPGITLVSLQKGLPADQLQTLPTGMHVLDVMGEITDFADTAALIASLDLVISVDTSVAHLAGALGKPVWILSRLNGCWRWLENRDDSPWYPTARLFRQTRRGDWDEEMQRLQQELRQFASAI